MMSVHKNHAINDLRIEMVRDLNDFMKVVAIRASVFLAEQDCPYDEEFDNNDLSASHLIAYLHNEPVATLRIRWFASFAKIERVCVMKHVRGGALVKLMIETAVDMIGRKGYRHVLGYIQKRLVPFWKQLGFHPREGAQHGLPGLSGVYGPKGIPIELPEEEAADGRLLAEVLVKDMLAR